MSDPIGADLASLLPAGVVSVVAEVAYADPAGLLPEERSMVPAGDGSRAREVAAGRWAARECLARLGLPPVPLPRRADGAPDWPASVRGSITHKNGLCLVVVGSSESVTGLGLDLEESQPLPEITWPLALTPGELERLPRSGGPLDPGSSRLTLCAKEAFLKWRVSCGLALPDLLDVEVGASQDRLRFQAEGPVPAGRFVLGREWTVAVVW